MSIVRKKIQAIISCLITNISFEQAICTLNLLLFQFNDKLKSMCHSRNFSAIISFN